MIEYRYTSKFVNLTLLHAELAATWLSGYEFILTWDEPDELQITVLTDTPFTPEEKFLLDYVVAFHRPPSPPDPDDPNPPPVSIDAGKYPVGYLRGLKVKYNSGDDVRIETGRCKCDDTGLSLDEIVDITNTINNLPVSLEKSKDNGLDVGTDLASTWYYIWLIAKVVDSATGVASATSANKLIDAVNGFPAEIRAEMAVYNVTDNTWAKVVSKDDEVTLTLDTDIFTSGEQYIVGPKVVGLASASSTNPTLPEGYIYKRRIGTVRNDAGMNIVPFYQIGNQVRRTYFRDLRNILSGGTAIIFTDIDASASVPPTSELAQFQLFSVVITGNPAAWILLRPNGSTAAAGFISLYCPKLNQGEPSSAMAIDLYCPDRIVEYKSTDATLGAYVYIASFVEEL